MAITFVEQKSKSTKILNHQPKTDEHHEIFHDVERGTIVCRNCGLVFETSVIIPEWSTPRIYNQEGSNVKGNIHNIENQALKRALKYNMNKEWKERKKKIGIWELHRLTSMHHFGQNVLKRAQYLFEKSILLEDFKFKYVTLISRVCFYYSARFYRFSVSIKEICQDNIYSVKLFGRYYYILIQKLRLKRLNLSLADNIPGICSKLRMSEDVVQKAKQIREKYIEKNNISGLNNCGINAAAIYLACCILHKNSSQKVISRAANVSDITLRSRLRKMREIYQKCS
nr:transcription initiation factor IIB family protein [Candidatus Prometheoarchaeum syntrophicum]QEE17643.1 Transcription initiation factor IIB [Candidatus Prometheoarchaeum syntrophicum]